MTAGSKNIIFLAKISLYRVYIMILILMSHDFCHRFNRASGLLGMSYAQFKPDQLGRGGGTLLKLLSMLRLVAMETGVGEKKDEIRVNNLTLINFVILWAGPQREDRLTAIMMAIQVRQLQTYSD